MRSILGLTCLLALLGACTSPERLTARATPCSTGETTILPSEFKREGVDTAWCARCKDKIYQCATNAARDKVECFEARAGGPCLR